MQRILRTGPVSGGLEASPGSPEACLSGCLHYRLARAIQSPNAAVAARRSRRRLAPSGTGREQELRRPHVPDDARIDGHISAPARRNASAREGNRTHNPWAFHRDSTPIKDYYDAWDKACRLAGVPDRLAHDLRRTAVRSLERAGVARSAAMKMTGHKTESIYRRYAIVDEAMLKESASKLAAFYAE